MTKDHQVEMVTARERILDAALDIIAKRGYSAAGVQEIVDQSSTSKGSFYFHFPSKEQMVMALLERMSDKLVNKVSESVRNQPTPLHRLAASVEVLMTTFARKRNVAQVLLLNIVGNGKATDKKFLPIREKFSKLIQQELDEAIVSGQIKPVDTLMVSRIWVGGLQEVILHWLLTGQPSSLTAATATLQTVLLKSVEADPTILVGSKKSGGIITPLTPAPPLRYALTKVLTRGQALAMVSNKSVLVSVSQPMQRVGSFFEIFAALKQSVPLRTFWARPEKDFWLIGKGSATELIADGETSMGRVAEKYYTLLKYSVIEIPKVSGVGPIVLGGFRYDTLATKDANWSGFPDAMLVIPRFLFTRSGGAEWLTINAMVKAETDIALQAEALIDELWTLDVTPVSENHQPVIKSVSEKPPKQYVSHVRKALEDIAKGRLTKVVLARRKTILAEGQFSLDVALENLCRNYPDCAIFAIDNGSSSFFGATPESLVRINQGGLSVTCLAGSTSRGISVEEDLKLEKQLRESPKEQWEHKTVVATVTESLEDLCRGLQWDNSPRILKLKDVQHLLTSVTGSLNPGKNILDIVKRLHPTPAVAGLPIDKALSFIRSSEGDRGWYAAPVGWADHAGGGEFVVGIRSALLIGEQAILQAGAGVVKGSDPEREFQETELKFQPLMAVLSGE